MVSRSLKGGVSYMAVTLGLDMSRRSSLKDWPSHVGSGSDWVFGIEVLGLGLGLGLVEHTCRNA